MIWIKVGQGPTVLTVDAAGGCLDIFLSSLFRLIIAISQCQSCDMLCVSSTVASNDTSSKTARHRALIVDM